MFQEKLRGSPSLPPACLPWSRPTLAAEGEPAPTFPPASQPLLPSPPAPSHSGAFSDNTRCPSGLGLSLPFTLSSHPAQCARPVPGHWLRRLSDLGSPRCGANSSSPRTPRGSPAPCSPRLSWDFCLLGHQLTPPSPWMTAGLGHPEGLQGWQQRTGWAPPGGGAA